MAKKNVIIIILTVLVFLSATMLGVASTFRVDDVCVKPRTVSAMAQEEAQALKAELTTAYHQESTFFASEDKAKEILKKYPYFRLLRFERQFPNLLSVEVIEDIETFAVATNSTQSSYYILNADGVVLGEREHYYNRADAELKTKNILISAAVQGATLAGAECVQKAFPFCSMLADVFQGEIRLNVLSVEFIQPTSLAQEGYFVLTMKEGVKIYVFDPTSLLQEKTVAAVAKYNELTDLQKMMGRVAVMQTSEGISCSYDSEDTFAK